jgi:hypothetical protein
MSAVVSPDSILGLCQSLVFAWVALALPVLILEKPA